jgi:hypothetical protein
MNKRMAPISERQIQRALRQFQLAGGKIQHIPDQPTPRHDAVASRSECFDGWTDPAAMRPLPPDAVQPAVE